MRSDQNNNSLSIRAPSDFRVIAIISTYNEEDIIIPVIDHLRNEGVEVYLIDNWSTDRTFELLKQIEDRLVGLERFPPNAPSTTYDWEDILNRKEELSMELDADWFMHYDADEIRQSPWTNLTLRDAIYLVDQYGYNAIDFVLLHFFPVNNNYQPGSSLLQHFKYFEYNQFIPDDQQVKLWKNTGVAVDLSKSGGHLVDFPNRKIFPCKFIMRHYPVRSQAHGVRKIIYERQLRYNPREKERGWHIHYDQYTEGTDFIKKPEDLNKFGSHTYIDALIRQMISREQLVEALSSQLVDTQAQLVESQSQLANTQAQLVESQSQLADTQTQINELKNIILKNEKK